MKNSSKFQFITGDTISIMDIVNALSEKFEVKMVNTDNQYRPEIIVILENKSL